LLHICPVLKLLDNIRIAVIGVLRLLNVGGSVISVGSSRGEHDMVHIVLLLNEAGVVRVWMDKKSEKRLTAIRCGTNPDIPILKTWEGHLVFSDIDMSCTQRGSSGFSLTLVFACEAAERR
jgi:hypothetical protein